ncbi:hypothetical protein AVEN_253603-1, partial [Araneus ventricosus]
MIAPADA